MGLLATNHVVKRGWLSFIMNTQAQNGDIRVGLVAGVV